MRDIIDHMSDIEKQLKDAAKATGWSILRLTRESGLQYQTVHGFIKAERQITICSAAKLANVLGLELSPVKKKVGR